MEHETYLATLAVVLPVFGITGTVELRFLVQRLYAPGRVLDGKPRTALALFAHGYVRLLAACVFGALILTVSCLHALRTGDVPGWLFPLLDVVVPLAPIVIAIPALGAVWKPQDLITRVEEPPTGT